jgi:asparagine synthetase B (glutamine-hydrolysing)
MCSFIVSNFDFDVESVNFYNQKRGPDATNVVKINGFTFLHNLLSITGEYKLQPFVEDDIVCLFNGEIYNYRQYTQKESDGECLIPLYKEHGDDYIKYLDGEFAIILFDFKKNKILISTDTFATKPVWISSDGIKFLVSSYKSVSDKLGRGSFKVPANTTFIYKMDGYKLSFTTKQNVKFDINQHKTNYDDVLEAFDKSIVKRSMNLREKPFIGLSSGYDSGAIAASLIKNNINFKSFSIEAQENKDIITKRLRSIEKANMQYEYIQLTRSEFVNTKKYINDNCEKFTYAIIRDGRLTPNEYMQDDKGAIGLAAICKRARDQGYKIYFSGQGADEIFSDYGFSGRKIYSHSCFGGMFPESLEKLFPWKSFYGSTQCSYLGKEECISGCYGIEGRYPFLDFNLVQEFLWLTSKCKNAFYKAPLHKYLESNNFAFDVNRKIGFSCDKNLKG